MGQPQTPRDTLSQWLQEGSLRERRQRLLHDSSWAVASLLVLAATYAAIARFVEPAAVVAALRPLFLLAALGIVVSVIARSFRRPDLASIAAAADSRAVLHDSLLSAHALGDRAGLDGFLDLHLQRAAQIARSLAVGRVFPLAVPPRALVVAGAALIAAVLLWTVPHRGMPDGERDEMFAAATSHAGARGVTAPGVVSDSAAADASKPAAGKLWKQIEALAEALSGSSETQSLAQAIAARDARAAARALQQVQATQPVPAANEARPAQTPDEQMSDALAKGILERLAELIKAEDGAAGAAPPAASDNQRTTARLDSELRAEQEDAQRAAAREQSEGEDALNTSLRALSRSSSSGRDMVHGEADSAEGAGRASMGGGAMGRRVGVSTAGAGEGDQPGANVAPLPAGDPIFGRKTERLAVQLRTVKMPEPERDASEDASGTEEAFFAATRAQSARTTLQSAGTVSGSEVEATVEGQRSPLEYRDAIKRYTLARHRREPAAARSEPAP